MEELLNEVRKLSEDLATLAQEAQEEANSIIEAYEQTVDLRILIKQKEYIEDKWRDAINHAEEASPYAIKDDSEITDEELEEYDKLYAEVGMLSEIGERLTKSIREYEELLTMNEIELPDDFY